jgi:peptide deformylase
MIIVNNEEALRVKCNEVLPEEVPELVSVLEKELSQANRLGKSGIGLAAPQIGIAKKIAIVRLGNTKDLNFNLVNPVINKTFDPRPFRQEGCLSFPGRVEDTIRFNEIHITNNNLDKLIITGLLSIVCQHEIDHLNATLFIDHKLPVLSKDIKIKPNDPCICGKIDRNTNSPKKFKKCCGLLPNLGKK